jgi:hypothetical protein
MDLVGKQGKLTGILMTGNLSWDCMGCYGSVWEFMGFYGIYCDLLGFIGILWDFIRTLIIFASLRLIFVCYVFLCRILPDYQCIRNTT